MGEDGINTVGMECLWEANVDVVFCGFLRLKLLNDIFSGL